MTVFAHRHDRFIPALEIATVIAALLLGAFFAARLLAQRPDPGAAALAPHAAEQLRPCRA